jgi:hypothetical protein
LNDIALEPQTRWRNRPHSALIGKNRSYRSRHCCPNGLDAEVNRANSRVHYLSCSMAYLCYWSAFEYNLMF